MFDSPPSPPIKGPDRNGLAARVLGDLARIGWRGPRLALPASVNLGIAGLLSPVINALLARASDPEAAIAGFAVAYGLMALIAIPQLRIQQLTLVFARSGPSLAKVRRFISLLALASFSVGALAAVSPLGGWLLAAVFGLAGTPLEQASVALAPLVIWIPLACFRTHFHGIMLATGRTGVMWSGIAISLLAAVLSTALLLFLEVPAAAAAASGHSIGVALEVLILYAADRSGHAWPGEAAAVPSYRELARFFGPLLVAALLPSVTIPILHAAMARAPDPATGIAAFTLARSVVHLATIPIWGLQPTLLALFGRGTPPRAAATFAYAMGSGVLAITLAISYLGVVNDLVLGQVLGAVGVLAVQGQAAMMLLALLPPLMAMEQIYSSALLACRRANPFIWINLLRLGILVLTVAAALLVAPQAVWVGAAGEFAGLMGEALVTMGFGRSSYRQLAEAAR